MYRGMKMVFDRERETIRVPEAVMKQSIYKDLFYQVMSTFVNEDRNIEDFLLRYTSTRKQVEAPHTRYGCEWVTVYELAAIPLEDARALLGRGY